MLRCADCTAFVIVPYAATVLSELQVKEDIAELVSLAVASSMAGYMPFGNCMYRVFSKAGRLCKVTAYMVVSGLGECMPDF